MQLRRLLVAAIVGISLLLAVLGNSLTTATTPNQAATYTVTVGTTLSTSQTQPTQIVNRVFKVVSTTGTSLNCELWNFTFEGIQGQYISGNFTSDIPLSFYLVQDSSYQGWLSGGTCGSAADAITSKETATSYAFSGVALPSSGKWDLVLVNFSSSRDADGSIVAYSSSASYTITQLLLSTITTTSAPTSATVSSSGTSIVGFPIDSIVIGLTAGIVALILLRRQRPKRR